MCIPGDDMSMWIYRTAVGYVSIVSNEDFRYDLLFESEPIGTYEDEQEAVDALCDGEVFQPKTKQVDFSMLDIPRNLHEWEYRA